MGVPSYTFGDVFFNYLSGCTKINLDNLQNNNLKLLINRADVNIPNDFSIWLNVHSALGIISDPVSNPACMTTENLDTVYHSFLNVCSEK